MVAKPDHIGWQINLLKLEGDLLAAALDASAALAERLKREGIISVFLVHPCVDGPRLTSILRHVEPDIFLASADRSTDALDEARASGAARSIMVPVGIPSAKVITASYDPLRELESYSVVADWYTTDTITESDTPQRFGCSGRTSDWESLSTVVERSTRPVIVAGGMTPGNVRALWEACRPAGFDAHTSVCSDGLPDSQKALAFTRAVRELA